MTADRIEDYVRLAERQKEFIATLEAQLAEAIAKRDAARHVALEEAARILGTRVVLYSDVDVSMTGDEERAWFASQIRSMAPLPASHVLLPRVLGLLGLCVVLSRCDDCSTAGKVQVSRLRGNQIERCDGRKWVPLTLENP